MLNAAWKSLLARKWRLVMSTFAIVLGVAFVAGTLVFSDTLNRSFTALFASTVGDVVVAPESELDVDEVDTGTAIRGDLVEELAAVEGAARADGQISRFGTYVIGEDGDLVGGQGPPALGGNWSDAPAANGLVGLAIESGREPQGPDEVVIDAFTAERAGYEVGDEVLLNLTQASSATLRPTLVGIADFADGGSLNGATLTLFDTRTAQELWFGGRDEFTEVWVTAEDGTSQEELRDAVAAVLPEGVGATTGDDQADESASDLLEAISFLTTFLLIFAGIALVVGGFLIVNTFSVLVAQRSRELALLRALGASGRQVTRSVLLEASALGLLGASLGLGLGILLALGIEALVAQIGIDLSSTGLVLQPTTVVAAYAVGVVVTVVAAYLPARRTARIAPVQALRDDVALPESTLHRRFVAGLALIAVGAGAMAYGLVAVPSYVGWWVGLGVLAVLLGTAAASPVLSRPFLALAAWVLARVFGPVGRLAGQNSLRNPRRTTATASALMIGLTLACTMAIVGASAKASVDETIASQFVGDYVVSGPLGRSFSVDVADEVAQVDGVAAVVQQRYGPARVDGEQSGVSAADPAVLARAVDVDVLSGSLDDLGDGTVLVTDEYAAEQDLALGDVVDVLLPAGPLRLEVVGTYTATPFLPFPLLADLRTLEEGGYPPADNLLTVVADDGARGPALQERLDAVVEDLPTLSVQDQQAFAEQQRAPIDRLVTTIFALLGLALVIAVLGIVNTLALSIIERTREVGLLRAVGVSRSQLRRMVTLESVVIASLGALLGVVLGTAFGVALMRALREEGLEVIDVPAGQLATFLGVSVVVGVLAAVLPARRAARLDVLRAISTD